MKKRFWALFLVFAMLLTMLPVDAFHANTPALKFYWCKQSNGVFETDVNGNYLPDIKEEEAVYSHQIPIDHSSPVFFYYEDETGTETAVDITSLQPSNPSLITLRPQNGCVVIEVSDNAKGNENLYIEYRDLNGTLIAQMPVRIDPIPGPALVYRPSINDPNGPVEDTGAAYKSRYSHDVGGSAGLFFYYVDENNTYSKVDPSQLIVGDTTIISKQSVNGAAHLEFLAQGYTDISYVAPNSVTYSVGITSNGTMSGSGTGSVVVPNVYFYTDIAGTTMIDPMTGFTVTDTVDTFYFIPKDNWTLTNVELTGDLANIATLTWDTNASYATIKITGTPNDGMWHSIRYTATNGTESITSDKGITLYSKLPYLYFRVCASDENGMTLRDDAGNYIPNMTHMPNKSFNMPASSGSAVFFYFDDGTGNAVPVSINELSVSDSNLVILESESGAVRVRLSSKASAGDTATIDYEYNGKIYHFPISSTGPLPAPPGGGTTIRPDVNFFLDSTGITRADTPTGFTVTDTVDTFYVIPKDGWRLTNVELVDDFADMATVTWDSTLATIKVTGLPNGMVYTVRYSATNGTESVSDKLMGINLYSKKSGLFYRWAIMDTNGNWVENPTDRLQTSYENFVGPERYAYFYMVVDGQETKVKVSDLAVSDNDVFKMVSDANDEYLAKIAFAKNGTTNITYTVNNKNYVIPVSTQLPPVGYYSSNVADYSTYITEFTVTDNVNSYYLIARNGYTFKEFRLDGMLSEIATYEMNSDKTIVKITITGTPRNDSWYGVYYEAEDGRGGYTSGNNAIPLYTDKTQFVYCRPHFENGQLVGLGEYQYQWDTSLGYGDDIWFLLVKGNNYERILAKDLILSNNSILKVADEAIQDSTTETITHIEATGWGQDEIKYTDTNGTTYRIPVVSDLGIFGYYKNPTKTQGNWLVNEYVVNNDNHVFYFMAMPDLFFREAALESACSKNADIKISDDKTYITITVTGESDDFWLDLHLVAGALACDCGGDCVTNDCEQNCNCDYCRPYIGNYGINIVNEMCDHKNTTTTGAVEATCTKDGFTGTVKCDACGDIVDAGSTIKALGHDTEVVDAKKASCTETGYTGDEVCKVCETTVTKGKEIAKIAHDTEVKGAKAATCTEAGYTGDEVCKVCETTVTKGEEIAKTAHDTEVKGAKAATCTETGYTGDEVCKTCKVTVKTGEVIAKTAHDIEVKDVKAVSCLIDGYTGDKVCKVCDTVVEKGEVVKASGHTYENLTCTICGDKMIVTEEIEDVDTSKPVEEVTPVVKQETVDIASKEVTNIIEAILSENVSEAVKSAVSEETLEAIKEAVESGAQIKTEVVTNVVTEEQVAKEDLEEIKEALPAEAQVAQYLDLSIMIKADVANGQEMELGTLNELTEKVSFVIAIPENLEKVGRDFYILRVHNDVVDKLEVTKNMDGTYTFETDKFSTYALVYEDNAVETNESPKTNDMTMWICTMVVVLSFGGVCFARKRRVVK